MGPMEQHALKNVDNCLNIQLHSYLEKSGGQCSILYLNFVHFFNTSANKTVVLLHWCLVCAVLLECYITLNYIILHYNRLHYAGKACQ
jgi:hypothetical protein